jgi:uncharacterized protein
MVDLSSPCTKVCLINAVHRICEGCGRSIEEISGWMAFSDLERQIIRAQAEARMKSLKNLNPMKATI